MEATVTCTKNVNDTVQVQQIDALSYDYAEADASLLPHAHHAASNFDNVIFQGLETDGMIISLSVSHKVECGLLFASGARLSRGGEGAMSLITMSQMSCPMLPPK